MFGDDGAQLNAQMRENPNFAFETIDMNIKSWNYNMHEVEKLEATIQGRKDLMECLLAALPIEKNALSDAALHKFAWNLQYVGNAQATLVEQFQHENLAIVDLDQTTDEMVVEHRLRAVFYGAKRATNAVNNIRKWFDTFGEDLKNYCSKELGTAFTAIGGMMSNGVPVTMKVINSGSGYEEWLDNNTMLVGVAVCDLEALDTLMKSFANNIPTNVLNNILVETNEGRVSSAELAEIPALLLAHSQLNHAKTTLCSGNCEDAAQELVNFSVLGQRDHVTQNVAAIISSTREHAIGQLQAMCNGICESAESEIKTCIGLAYGMQMDTIFDLGKSQRIQTQLVETSKCADAKALNKSWQKCKAYCATFESIKKSTKTANIKLDLQKDPADMGYKSKEPEVISMKRTIGDQIAVQGCLMDPKSMKKDPKDARVGMVAKAIELLKAHELTISEAAKSLMTRFAPEFEKCGIQVA